MKYDMPKETAIENTMFNILINKRGNYLTYNNSMRSPNTIDTTSSVMASDMTPVTILFSNGDHPITSRDNFNLV